jgi:hypothetical protein
MVASLDWISKERVFEELGIGKVAWHDLTNQYGVKPVRFGKRVFVHAAEVSAAFAQMRTEQADPKCQNA